MPIKSTGLPNWFSLKKYDGLRDATLEDWLTELSNRSLSFEDLLRAKQGDPLSGRYVESSTYLWEQIKQHGSLTSNHREALNSIKQRFSGRVEELFDDSRHSKLTEDSYVSIRRTSKLDVLTRFYLSERWEEIVDEMEKLTGECEYENSFRAEALNASDQDAPGDVDVPDELTTFPREEPSGLPSSMDAIGTFPDSSERLITIDLEAPDDLILREFSEWLAVQRSVEGASGQRGPKKCFDRSDFEDWIDFRVLAFIDLRFACMNGECRLTQHVIGEALFPDEYNVSLAERVRKAVLPRADLLMSARTRAAMFRQIEADANRPGG